MLVQDRSGHAVETPFRTITVAPSIRNMENSRRPYGELQQAHASSVVHGAGYVPRCGFWSSKAASQRANLSVHLLPYCPRQKFHFSCWTSVLNNVLAPAMQRSGAAIIGRGF